MSEERRTHIIGDEGLGLAPRGLVQSDPVWCGLVQRFMRSCKMISNTEAPNLRGKFHLAFE
jgi:hypothetical protein